MAVLAAVLLWPHPLGAQAGRPGPPPIPPVRGPLAVSVVYPQQGQRITATDSTFLFGSTGDGRASLTVNGTAVPVAPNGAFLAWVPVPRDSAPVFRFVARLDAESAVTELGVLLPRAAIRPDTGLWVDEGSFAPSGSVWAESGELLRVSVVAAPDARVFLELFGRPPIPLVPDTVRLPSYGPFDRQVTRAAPREVRYVGAIPADALADSVLAPQLAVERDGVTMRRGIPLRLSLVHPDRRPVVLLDDDTARAGNTDGAVAGTPVPQGTYHWFFRNGTPAAVSGRAGSQLRLRLSGSATAWVAAADVALMLPAGTPEPRAQLRLVRLTTTDGYVSARLALTSRIPFRVDEDGTRLTVRFYGARADADWLQYGSTEPFIERMTWEQATLDEVTVTFVLPRPVFGWRTRWDGSDLVLDIRRPPRINAARPLAGRVIALDPGHPPAGATGPTGLREAEANLAIARELLRMLQRAGARVIMARDADTSVGLYERTNLAEAMGAEVLVSIHNNAFPDGVNPWLNHGTSSYYYHPRSVRLARHVQAGMLRTMGLRDLGFGRGDLALVRVTWMPSVLTEGAFLMIPEQEQGLRTPSFQRAYARGVADGLAAYFRELAR